MGNLRGERLITFSAEDGGRKPPDDASGTYDKGVPGQHYAADAADRHQQKDKYHTDFLPVHIVTCFFKEGRSIAPSPARIKLKWRFQHAGRSMSEHQRFMPLQRELHGADSVGAKARLTVAEIEQPHTTKA